MVRPIIFIILLFILIACNYKNDIPTSIKAYSKERKQIIPKFEGINLYLLSQCVNTDTIILTDKSLLYYQFNQDSIWLTLENSTKNTIFSTAPDLYPYHHRLDYQFEREFDNYLLFRYGCPANGPCDYVLIDKVTGEEFQKLPQLIFNYETGEIFDYLIYFSEDLNYLIFNNVNTNHIFKIRHNIQNLSFSPVPEYIFTDVKMFPQFFELYYYQMNRNERTDTSLIVRYR